MASTAEILALMDKMQPASQDAMKGQAFQAAAKNLTASGQLTPFTALAAGIMNGMGTGMELSGKKQESDRKTQMQAMMQQELLRAQQLEERQAYVDGLEGELKAMQLAKAEREQNATAVDEALGTYLQTGNTGVLDSLVQSLPQNRSIFAKDLKDEHPDANMIGFKDQGGGNVVVVGVKPDGTMVQTSTPMPALALLSPEGKAKYFQAQKAQFDAQKAEKDVNAGSTFIIKDSKGQQQTMFGTQADAEAAAKRLGGTVVGKTEMKTDLTGAESGIMPAKNVAADMQKDMVSQQDAISRMQSIKDSFNPDFLRLQGKMQAGISNLKDKIGELPPEEAAQLQEYSTFVAKTAENMNLLIKEMSGAAVSDQESGRLQKQIPNDADGPTQFQAKLESATETVKAAYARRSYMLKNGIQDVETMSKLMPLEKVKSAINKEGADLVKKYTAEGMDEAQAAAKAKADLKEMFGL